MRKRISGAELEIMEHFWSDNVDRTFSEIMNNFSKEKKWSKQTLNTYLLRLKKRGFLQQEKTRNKSLYRATLTRLDYEQMCAQEILQESYGGFLSNFIAALTGKSSITEIEKEELLKYIIEEKENKE